ncbi:MAG: hypothetical protein QOD68_981 [Actinomycetota bacterium]|nr:hypothetical protein [Actinomycetota bacterium]
MKRVLLTGMSGTGKSSVVRELVARGYKAVDTDDGWCEPLPDGRQQWREAAVRDLLSIEDADVLFVAGCEENQVGFHPRFDQIILLSAPIETMLERLSTRTTNPFGKSAEERQRVLDDTVTVEPLLRGVADHEVVTTMSLDDVVTTVLRLVSE